MRKEHIRRFASQTTVARLTGLKSVWITEMAPTFHLCRSVISGVLRELLAGLLRRLLDGIGQLADACEVALDMTAVLHGNDAGSATGPLIFWLN